MPSRSLSQSFSCTLSSSFSPCLSRCLLLQASFSAPPSSCLQMEVIAVTNCSASVRHPVSILLPGLPVGAGDAGWEGTREREALPTSVLQAPLPGHGCHKLAVSQPMWVFTCVGLSQLPCAKDLPPSQAITVTGARREKGGTPNPDGYIHIPLTAFSMCGVSPSL